MEFQYQVRTSQGDKKSGIVKAVSREVATRLLQDKGFYVTSLRPVSHSVWKKEIRFSKGVKFKEVAIFARQFAVMIKSNVPIVSTLQALARRATSDQFRTTILEVADKVEGGSLLSQGLRDYPKIFDPFFISVIESGEATGRMGESLDYLADHLERQFRLRSNLKGAMIYPIFVLATVLIAFVLMMTMVIPNLVEALSQFDEELPWMTKVIIGLSDFFTGKGGIILIFFLIALIVGAIIWRRTKTGKEFYNRISLRLPMGIGAFFRKYYLTRFAENLAVLVQAGLPISEALKISGRIVGNNVYRRAIEDIQKKVVRGERISVAMEKDLFLFDIFMIQMIKVGERTGQTGQSLMKVVDFYQDEISRKVKNLSSIIEPVLIVFLGAMVAFLVFAVYIPIFTVEMGAM